MSNNKRDKESLRAEIEKRLANEANENPQKPRLKLKNSVYRTPGWDKEFYG